MLDEVKKALRISTEAMDSEISDLIASALADLGLTDISEAVLDENTCPALVRTAVKTYCKMHFGVPEDYDRLKRSYDEQKAQLSMATGYTNWTVSGHV